MVERREHFGFALKASETVRVGGEVCRQRFDGDLPVQPRIACKKHLTHAAAAEFSQNLKWANGGWLHAIRVYYPGDCLLDGCDPVDS